MSVQKFLIQQNESVYAINSSFNLIGQLPCTKEMFDKYGADNLNSLTQSLNLNSIAMNDDGFMGSGKCFSCNLNNEIISLNTVNIK